MAKVKNANATKKSTSKKSVKKSNVKKKSLKKLKTEKRDDLKKLSARKHVTLAKDIMSTSLVILNAEQTFGHAVEILTLKRLTVLPVVDAQGKLLGILSEKDILKACDSFENVGENFLDQKIKYETEVVTVNTHTPINQLGPILANRMFRHLPVVDQKGFLKGIISRRDLIRVIYLRHELQRVIHVS